MSVGPTRLGPVLLSARRWFGTVAVELRRQLRASARDLVVERTGSSATST
jgi:hypothetical protein